MRHSARALPALLQVPGNLLFLGEYAVLEEGGLGIAAAIGRRVLIEAEGSKELTIVGRMPGREEHWRRGQGGTPGLFDFLVAELEAELEDRGLGSSVPPLRLTIDSTALFDGGTKLGLGSSAAVAAGVAYAILGLAGLETEDLVQASFRRSLAAHRARQGGRGSGYDLAASLCGGHCLFVGGKEPSFTRLELPWMPPPLLVRGPGPVDTPRAIASYDGWKAGNAPAARRFLEASNEAVAAFASAKSWEEARPILAEGARLGIELGDAIGVGARLAPSLEMATTGSGIAKALGAGDELGALWREDWMGLATGGTGSLGVFPVDEGGPLWTGQA